MQLDTVFLERCITTLELALKKYSQAEASSINADLYRSACIKEFEIILEQSGKLLKKAIKPFFASPAMVDRLVIRDVFRHAANHGLLPLDACERWLMYRDNGNNTSHDYGATIADETVALLPGFAADARHLLAAIHQLDNHNNAAQG
ncbi:MAG: nucleotidyltransferase [Chitinophagia bacterium]|nr:nucleotidyltransferase [Chitinophagia bacterium]